MPQGKAGIRNGIAAALARLELRLPKIVIEALHEQWLRITELSSQISQIEHKLQSWLKTDVAAIADIPGVGFCNSGRGHHGRPQGVQIRTRVCSVAGSGAQADRDRR